MANINDALGAFALGTLSKAAGQDFLTPMLDDVRQRDRFSFQRKQLEAAADRDRKREQKERETSQRGLLSALKAAGAFRDEDFIAAGGEDEISKLDAGDFQVAISQLQQNRLRDVDEADYKNLVRARAAADGFTLHPDADIQTYREVAARLDMRALERAESKERESEARNSWGMRIGTSRAFAEDSLSDPTQVTEQTVAELAARFDADGLALASDPDLDGRSREGLRGLHEMSARMIQRAQRMAEATAVANGSQADILRAWAERPEMRSSLRLHETVVLARQAAQEGAGFVMSLAPGEVPELDGLLSRFQEKGSVSAVVDDGNLAAEAVAVTGRLGEYREQQRLNKETKAATEAGEKLAAAIENSLPAGKTAPVTIKEFVRNGQLDVEGVSKAVLAPVEAEIERASSAELSVLDRSLERAGNFPGVGRLRSRISERRAQEAQHLNPSQVRQEAYLAEKADYVDVSRALSVAPPFVERQTARSAIFPVSTVTPVIRRTVYDPNPAWISEVRGAFQNLDVGLRRGMNEVSSSLQELNSRQSDFVDDPDTRRSIEGFMAGLQAQGAALQARLEARELLVGTLSSMDLEHAEDAAKDLNATAGTKSDEVETKAARQKALATQDPKVFLTELHKAMKSGPNAKALPDETLAALGAEISMLDKFMDDASKLFQGEDEPKVRRALKAAGILTSEDAPFPEVELVRWFMLNR